MLKRVLHRIASHPLAYDLIQLLAGARFSYQRLASQAATIESGLVLDLGGGTGLYRQLWPSDCVYVCLDVDILKLQRFIRKNPDCSAILADATCVPIKDNSVDVVVCIAVSHHLWDTSLQYLIRESERVLKTAGTFLFLDAVWAPSRWSGRLLWKYDRGSYPRTAEYLHSVIWQQYRIVHCERYAIFHEYVLYRGIKYVGGNE